MSNWIMYLIISLEYLIGNLIYELIYASHVHTLRDKVEWY